MDPTQKAALIKNNLLIKKNVTNIDSVLDILLKEDCLQWEERIELSTEKSLDEKCQKLLEILIKRGGICYQSFVDALNITGNDHITKEIEEARTSCKGIEKRKDSAYCDKDRIITDLRIQIDELQKEIGDKNDKMKLLKDQQRRALDDLKKQKERNVGKDACIKELEKKNTELEKEINRLKATIESIQKQLRKVEDEKKRVTNEQLKAIQNLEKKQEATQKTCEKINENFAAFAKDVSKAFLSLQSEMRSQNHKEIQEEVVAKNVQKKTNTKQAAQKMPTCNFSDNAWKGPTTRHQK